MSNRYKHLIIQLDIYKPRLLRLDLQTISENHNFMSKNIFFCENKYVCVCVCVDISNCPETNVCVCVCVCVYQ